MAKHRGGGYVCEGCGTFYPLKEDAEVCEQRHHLIQLWAEGKVDDLAVARGLGLPTGTPQELQSSVRSVRNLLHAGSDVTLTGDAEGGMREAPPVFRAATKIHSDGRVQVPADIRSRWGVGDGDFLFWYSAGVQVIVSPTQVPTAHRQPRFSYRGREQPSPP